jgi:predicted N-acetyltransferase YhbS
MTTMQTYERARLRVRPATGADHGRIRELIARAYKQYEATLPAAVFRAYMIDLTDLDARTDADLLVAETDSQIVGTVTYYADASAEGFGWPRGWAGVRALAVDPAHRGLGIAGCLMETCIDRAYAGGAPVVCLHTGNFMPAAVGLYEGLDFRRTPTHDVDVTARLGAEGDAVVAMAYTRTLRPR